MVAGLARSEAAATASKRGGFAGLPASGSGTAVAGERRWRLAAQQVEAPAEPSTAPCAGPRAASRKRVFNGGRLQRRAGG